VVFDSTMRFATVRRMPVIRNLGVGRVAGQRVDRSLRQRAAAWRRCHERHARRDRAFATAFERRFDVVLHDPTMRPGAAIARGSSFACVARRRASGEMKMRPPACDDVGVGLLGAATGVGAGFASTSAGFASAFGTGASAFFAIGDFAAVASADLSSPSSSRIAIG